MAGIKTYPVWNPVHFEVVGFGEKRIINHLFQQIISVSRVGDAGNGHSLVSGGQPPEVRDAVFRYNHHPVIGRCGQGDAGGCWDTIFE